MLIVSLPKGADRVKVL